MPLAIICGHPGCGASAMASAVAAALHSRLGEGAAVVVVSDASVNAAFDRDAVYSSATLEKEHRGLLRSHVNRLLPAGAYVVLDSLNYIKSFRYELFCSVKSAKSRLCVVEVVGSTPAPAYSTETAAALRARYEAPEARNRWDSPLLSFSAAADESDDVVSQRRSAVAKMAAAALADGVCLKENVSTQSQPLASGDFLQRLDAATRLIIQELFQGQFDTWIIIEALGSSRVSVSGASAAISLPSTPVTMAQLARLRRQFIALCKGHPVADPTRIPELFVAHLNAHLPNLAP